jgi:hypothetical protein
VIKSPLLPRILLGLAVVSVLLVIAGLYFMFDNTNRYNELAAIDLQPLIATMKENQINAQTVATVGLRMQQAEVARDQAFALIGAGAILLGLTALVYTRLPDKIVKSSTT